MNQEIQDNLVEIENVRVVVRIRPLNEKERSQGDENIAVVYDQENVLVLNDPKQLQRQSKSFKFDWVFPENCTQMELYQRVALPIVEQIFKGYNGTIFAYGQTGSGKTHTMSGHQNENQLQGVIPNTFSHIFSKISRASREKNFVVTATYIEIYNEKIRDLLSVHPNEILELGERVDVGVYIKGLTGFTVDSTESITNLLNVGNMNRSTGATLMNNLSSRSHAIFTITVEAKDRENKKTTSAKLNLVDLAGSERLKRSQATGIGFKEATNINRSLFVLSNVISALVEEKTTHVPYRNSKLTRLLQDSLGGNSKTAMIATISPSSNDYEESLCTLRYASRAKLIKNRIHLNLQTDKGLIQHFQQEISLLKEQLANILKNESSRNQKGKKNKPQSKEILEKRKVQSDQLLAVENMKKDLNKKISSIQNKILTGGQILSDKAQEQQFQMESIQEEMKVLDISHSALEETLHKQEIKHNGLRDVYMSLQDQDKILDRDIEEVQKRLAEVKQMHAEEEQENQYELNLLSEHLQTSRRELELTNFIIGRSMSKQQLNKIVSNTSWNSDRCDFQINGIPYAGNNEKIPKRRRHKPQSTLTGFLLHQRKNRANVAPVKQSSRTNEYRQYARLKRDETDDSN